MVAKGYGLVAEMIVRRAREEGLFVHESPEMDVAADAGEPGCQIPPLLYQAVAELLAWLYKLEAGEDDTDPGPAPAYKPQTKRSSA